jgi:hypothetical protein
MALAVNELMTIASTAVLRVRSIARVATADVDEAPTTAMMKIIKVRDRGANNMGYLGREGRSWHAIIINWTQSATYIA